MSAGDAEAGTCVGAAPPYDVPAQTTTVNLDTDCAGAGGQVNVIGDVTTASGSAIFDATGSDQDWAILVSSGRSVTNSTSNITINFQSPNGSVDNRGTIENTGGGGAISFFDSAGPGSIINRNGGIIRSQHTGVTISLNEGGTVTNMAGGLIDSPNGGAISSQDQPVTVVNAGIINAPSSGIGAIGTAVSSNAGGTVTNSGTMNGRVNFFSGGTLFLNNSGSITGSAGDEAVRSLVAGTVINSGTITAGAGQQFAIDFFDTSPKNDVLELRPGFSINGDVRAWTGTDTLRFGGSGNETFDLDDIDDGTLTRQYQGFETFNVIGGDWDFSGTTAEAFSVLGGSLGGTGTFGALNIANGGTIAPGNSIGTLNVGNITFAPGSTYEVEVDAAGNSDLINATGTATINGGTVSVLAQSGDYAPSTRYRILRAAGGRTGVFSNVTSNLAFLDPTLRYDANNVFLILRRVAEVGGQDFLSFCSVATSANQCSVAQALDRFPTDNALFLEILNQTAAGARQAFDALSGEIHASLGGALIDESRHVREAVLGRLMQASYGGTGLGSGGPQTVQTAAADVHANMMAVGYGSKDLGSYAPLPVKEGPTFWTQGFGAWADFDGNGNAAPLDRDLGGFVSGVDAEVRPGWRAGIAAGYSYTGFDQDARLSSADVDAYHLVLYGSGKVSHFDLRGGGAWSWQDIETSRNVVFPGFSEFESASYDGDRAQLFGEIAYPLALHQSIAVESFSGLAYVHQETDGFTESGALAALTSSGFNEDVTYSTMGVRAATTMTFRDMVLTPNLSVAWLHAYDDIDTDLALAFASTGIGFDIIGTPIAEDTALITAGLDFAMSESATLSLSYDGQFGNDTEEHGLKGRASWKF